MSKSVMIIQTIISISNDVNDLPIDLDIFRLLMILIEMCQKWSGHEWYKVVKIGNFEGKLVEKAKTSQNWVNSEKIPTYLHT